MIQLTPHMRKCGAPHFRIYVNPSDMWSIDHAYRRAMGLSFSGFT